MRLKARPCRNGYLAGTLSAERMVANKRIKRTATMSLNREIFLLHPKSIRSNRDVDEPNSG